jgi:co-chaperonin GroES (HSP10)
MSDNVEEVIIPMGDRCFVEELPVETSLAKRAEGAGLHIVLAEENIPKPTTGTVVALGDDPLIQERLKIGDVVSFAKHAGCYQHVRGVQYRCLEGREIISVIRKRPVEPRVVPPTSLDPATASPNPTQSSPGAAQPELE